MKRIIIKNPSSNTLFRLIESMAFMEEKLHLPDIFTLQTSWILLLAEEKTTSERYNWGFFPIIIFDLHKI